MSYLISKSRVVVASSIICLMALCVQPKDSYSQVGAAAVTFLQIEPDSRSAAMGNANVATASDANAIFWNPAGLGFQEGFEGSITHSQWLPQFDAGLFYDYLAGKYHVPNWGTFGAHVTYLNLGEHECRTEDNQSCGTFRSYDMAIGGSYGVKLSNNLALGTGIRFIYSNLAPGQIVGAQETRAGVSVGVDLAALYKTNYFKMGGITSQVSFGANLANMGPTIQYSDSEQADPIPMNMRFGWSWTMDFDQYNKLTFSQDFNKLLVDRDSSGVAPFYQAIFTGWKGIQTSVGPPSDGVFRDVSVLQLLTIGSGFEYMYNNLFAFRGGYFWESQFNGNRKFLTIGAGIRYNVLGVDFSYIYPIEQNHPLADTIRFSLIVGRK